MPSATEETVAAENGLTVTQLRQAISDFKQAAKENAASGNGKPRVKWDKDRLPDENPAAFAWRAYQAEAKAGTLHRGVIRREDKLLAVKLSNWLQSHPMPEGIDIPTKPEWITRQIEAWKERPVPPKRTQEQRLYDTLRHRRARHHPAAGAGTTSSSHASR
jgi:hypothetical protein